MAAVPWQALAAQLSPLTLLTEQLHKLAYRTFPLAILSLSSSESLVSETSWLMGRRDKRTRKGKVFKGSSGNVSHVGMFDNSTIIQAAQMARSACLQARPKRPQQPSLRWQREQQQAVLAQKPIPIPYPAKKAVSEASIIPPIPEAQLEAQ